MRSPHRLTTQPSSPLLKGILHPDEPAKKHLRTWLNHRKDQLIKTMHPPHSMEKELQSYRLRLLEAARDIAKEHRHAQVTADDVETAAQYLAV